MSKKSLTLLLIFSLLINISAVVTFGYFKWFDSDKERRDDKPPRHRVPLHEKLNINEEQTSKMNELRKSLFKELGPLKTEIRQHRMQLVEMISQDTVSAEEIYKKIEQISEQEKMVQKKIIDNMLELRTVLNDEQRQEFLKMMAGRIFDDQHSKFKRRWKPRKEE